MGVALSPASGAREAVPLGSRRSIAAPITATGVEAIKFVLAPNQLCSNGIFKVKTAVVASSLLVLLGISVTHAQQAGKTSTASGVFSAEQAKNGERAFQAKCATCHGSDLRSTEPEAPDLTEGAFRFGWQGKTIANRFEEIRGTMPYGNARSLDDQTYLDIVAYILAFNGIPSGNQKLEPNVPALEKIVITVPGG
jgi:cytochrome c553